MEAGKVAPVGDDPFKAVTGIIKTDRTTDELMEIVRPRDLTDEEWQRP